MKKLLGLLGTIMITGNAIPSVIAAAPNRKHNIKKRQNNENISTTPKEQDDQQAQFLANSDSKVDIIEKEITLNENYSDNIQKMLQELIDENYINPLRSINMGGLISKELDNKTIISKLEKIEPKMANWIKKQQNNKDKILILTLKNSNNKSIKLVINLNNFYLLGFINNQNQYFYFDDEILEKIKQNNQNEITELEKIKTNLEKLNKLIKEKNKDKIEKENLEWEIKEKLNKLKELDKLKEQVKIEKNSEEIIKIENNIKNINKLIKEEINKSKDLNKLNKELIEARKAKLKEQINETNQKIEKLKKEIFIPIPSINYNNDKKYLDNKIKNLQGEGLKNEEIKTKVLNTKVTEFIKGQKINLNYTGAYSEDGLDVVIKEKDKPTIGKNINISNDTLNTAISNLSKYDNNKQENQTIKDDLVRIIFITSEAMRFQCDEKTLEIFANIKNIYELEKIIVNSKNILIYIQEKIFNKNQTINWKDYTSQLRGDWKKYSEQFNKFRIEIWEQLIKIKKMHDFIYNNQDIINEIFKKENENYNIIKAVENLFDNPQNKDFSDKKIKVEILNYIQKQIEIRKFFGKLYNMINIKQININKNQLFYNIGINKNQENFLLVISVYQKNLDIIKLLINLFPKSEIINGNSNDFFSPLNIALSLRYTEIVKELLKHKNINLNKTEPLCNTSPLHTAVRLNKTEIVKELLKNPKIDVNIKAINDITPLHLAVIIGNNEIVRELLKHPKINVNVIAKKDNVTNPFSVEIFDKLKHYDTDINLEKKIKLTPLFFAEIFGKTQIAEELLKHHKINTDSSLKKIIPNFFEEEMEKHFNSKEFEQELETQIKKELEKHLKNKIELCNELLKKVQDEQQKNKIIKSLEETKKALEELKKPKRNEKLDKEKKETGENKKKYEEIIKEMEEYINSKDFQEQFKNNLTSELNKYLKENKELKEFSKIMQNYGNSVKEKQNELIKEVLKIKLWDFIITNRNLGEITDNSEQTILKNVRELNSKLDFFKKIKVTNINITTALITSDDENCFGGAVVIFTIKKKINELGFGGFKSGFLNQPPKSANNSNSNVSVDDYPRTSDTQGQYSNKKQQYIMHDVPADNSCLFWSVATSYLLPIRNNSKEFKKRFIQLFGEENLKYLQLIQKLLKQYNLEYNRNLNQLWYQDQTAINLVTDVFRNNVVDYIERNLDTVSNHGGELTFRNLIQENNEVESNYLERMRESSTWGGTPEIVAMSNLLNANINVNNDSPYQPINQNSSNTINIFHVNNGTHYNFALTPEDQPNQPSVINDNQRNAPVVDTTNRPNNLQPINTKSERKVILSNNDNDNQGNNIINPQEKMEIQLQKNEYHFLDKKTEDNSLKNDKNLEINLIKNNNKINTNAPLVNKPISTNKNMENLQTTNAKTINKYNTLSKAEKQQKLNEINQHYQNLSENDKKNFKDKLKAIGTSAIGAGISAVGTKITVSGGAASNAAVSTGEAMEMTSLLSEEGLAAAETLSVAEGTTAVIATEGSIIGAEAATASALAPETLGLSLVIGGLAIAGTAIIWWLSGHDNTQAVKHESHNQYNEIDKYYKFLSHDQLKLDININEWNKIKQIYQENSNNYQEFKNKIKSEITNFHKEDHSGWGGSITDNDIDVLIKLIYNHFQEINNHFSSNSNHGWKIVTNTIGSYFIIEEE